MLAAATAAFWIGCSEPKRTDPASSEVSLARPIYQFAISTDSGLLATIGMQRVIRVQKLATRQTVHTLAYGNRRPIFVAFRADENALVAVYHDGSIVLWNDLVGNAPRRNELFTLPGNLTAAYCSNDWRIAVVDKDNVLSIRDRDSQRWQRSFSSRDWISHLSFSPDGRSLLSCGFLSGVRIWNVDTGAYTTLAGSRGLRIRSARYSPDGRRIVTAGFDGRVREWNARDGSQLWSKQHCNMPLTAVCYTPDGRSIVVGTYDGEVFLCENSSPQSTCVVSTHASAVTQLEFTPDGTLHFSTQGGELVSLRLDEARNCD